MAHADLFVVQIAPIQKKKKIKLKVSPKFFRIAGLQQKLLILIESPNIFHWKLAKKESGWGLRGKVRAKLGPVL